MGLAAVVNAVRSVFDRSSYRYRPLAGSSASGDEEQQRRRGRARAGDEENDGGDGPNPDGVWARSNRSVLKLTLVLVSVLLVLYLGVAFSRVAARDGDRPCDSTEHGYQCYPSVARHWGQYAPFFSVPTTIRADDADDDDYENNNTSSTALPPRCRYTFAQVLSRHGARDPTPGKSVAYAALVARIQEAVGHADLTDGPDGAFGFLADYRYALGADELTRFGELQLVHSGAHFYRRYASLIEAGPAPLFPFVRSAGQHRVVMSAVNWVQGFQRAAGRKPEAARDGRDGRDGSMLILPEEPGFNNTLSYNGVCKAFTGRRGIEAQRIYGATFLPAIAARLNRGLPGANISEVEAVYLMDLCPFETVADRGDGGSEGRVLSPFCRLFSEAEWRAYDYLQTLGKWYGYGDGSALGATQGAGFVSELVARLTQTPVQDRTSTNRTLDADPATFPLNATLYADFSHDNDMSNIFAALGLFNGTAALQPSNTTRVEPADLRGFAASWTVPFAARLYVEKMACAEAEGDQEGEELVRVLVNDRVVPLVGCGADSLGRCTLSRFVDSLAFARSGGRWDECFV